MQSVPGKGLACLAYQGVCNACMQHVPLPHCFRCMSTMHTFWNAMLNLLPYLSSDTIMVKPTISRRLTSMVHKLFKRSYRPCKAQRCWHMLP